MSIRSLNECILHLSLPTVNAVFLVSDVAIVDLVDLFEVRKELCFGIGVSPKQLVRAIGTTRALQAVVQRLRLASSSIDVGSQHDGHASHSSTLVRGASFVRVVTHVNTPFLSNLAPELCPRIGLLKVLEGVS